MIRRVETVVVALLDGAVVDAALIVVVVARTVVVVEPETLALVRLGQPPLGAGIMSPLCPPWPLRLFASTVIVT